MSATAKISEFASRLEWDDLSPEVVAIAIDHMVDSWGVMLAGSVEECSQIVRRVTLGSGGRSPVFGTGEVAPALGAALLNATAGHALDYDDTQLSTSATAVYGLLTHPSVPVVAALSALSSELEVDGRLLITAYVAGVEVACRIADAMDPRHYQDGFHSTGTVGGMGAAAACARLLGLDQMGTATALGIAASLGSGLRENFGTMTKPLHSGRSGYNGLLAARLAQSGFTASTEILEAPRGFFSAAAGGFDEARLLGQLGQPMFLASPGVSIKPYPSGSLGHPAEDLILDLVAELDLRPDDIQEVVVGTNSNVLNALIHHRPRTGLEGKFSLEYAIATAVLRRRAGLAEFTDAAVLDPQIQTFLPRVKVVVDPDLEALGYQHVRTKVEVICQDGRRMAAQAEWARGYPSRPLEPAALDGKFIECAEVVMPRAQAEEALGGLRAIDQAESAARTLELLQPEPTASAVTG